MTDEELAVSIFGVPRARIKELDLADIERDLRASLGDEALVQAMLEVAVEAGSKRRGE